jgi:serine protease Do
MALWSLFVGIQPSATAGGARDPARTSSPAPRLAQHLPNPLDSAAMTQPLRARCRRLCAPGAPLALISLTLCLLATAPPSVRAREVTPERLTPIVLAVRQVRASVVSIQGQKTVANAVETASGPDVPRQVNGMGTGTIVDERGYILTNYHVVSDVRRIEIMLDDGRGYVADLVAYDAAADLAIIKIPAPKPLSVIRFGTSADLMEGESVIALGNAFGYEQTVTRGIVSALGRDVQVSDTQAYDDLIQTDASINPGNSGGPLLNIDGEMIGVNVAVRAGAQGIGFAIPIDQALRVAAKLISVQRLQGKWHGLGTQPNQEDLQAPLHITTVESGSPAESSGLRPGDQIVRIDKMAVVRPLDLERALLDRPAGVPIPIEIRRGDESLLVDLALDERQIGVSGSTQSTGGNDQIWDVLGLRLSEEPRSTFQRRSTRYRGGMRVDAVRPNSPAALEGMQPGDILVGMHRWETASQDDIRYIISRPNFTDMGKVKFYVLRGQNTLYGHLNVAEKMDTSSQSTTRR